jgi:hypothetical protein
LVTIDLAIPLYVGIAHFLQYLKTRHRHFPNWGSLQKNRLISPEVGLFFRVIFTAGGDNLTAGGLNFIAGGEN